MLCHPIFINWGLFKKSLKFISVTLALKAGLHKVGTATDVKSVRAILEIAVVRLLRPQIFHVSESHPAELAREGSRIKVSDPGLPNGGDTFGKGLAR